MKGRKPKENAIRRGLRDMYMQAGPDAHEGVTMPEDIAADPVQSEIWAWIAPPVNRFAGQDMPALRLLCYWHAVALQAQQAMASGDGTVNIFDRVGTKPYRAAGGEEVPLVRKHPALSVLKEASAEIRALSDQLGLSPLARSRIGLMDANTRKTAADTAAMFKTIDAAYELIPVEAEVR